MPIRPMLRSRRIPPEVAAAAHARVLALRTRAASAMAPQVEGVGPMPAPVPDAPPWPSAPAVQPEGSGPSPAVPAPPPASSPAGPESQRVGLESAHLEPQSPAVQVPGHGGTQTGRALLGAGLASLLPPAVRAGRLAVDV